MRRTRLRGFNRNSLLPLILGGLGLGILVFAIPWRVWMIFVGLGLLGYAWYVAKSS